MKHPRLYLLFILLTCIIPLQAQRARVPIPRTNVPVIKPDIVSSIPHDTEAFTQGFLYRDGYLYESTGIVGRSSLRRIESSTGEIKDLIPVPDVFGEGIAVFENELVQLTWKSNVAIRYTYPGLRQKGLFRYEGQGWGLTSDKNGFVMSNGSDTLYFRDSAFDVYKTTAVTLDGKPLSKINELEYTNGKVYANVWKENYFVEIDPKSGTVTRLIDCSELVSAELPLGPEQVLNGIAYSEDSGLWYITGKEWEKVYIVRLEN